MLDTMLGSGVEIDPESQAKLYEVLLAKKDYSNLAKMCQIPNLDEAVDAKLGTLDPVMIRAAWFNRPGRDPETVVRNLKSERRVGVICGLMGQELPDELYPELLARSSSNTVALAAVMSSTVPRAVREDASRRIAAGHQTLNSVQQTQVRNVWRENPGLASVALETASSFDIVARLSESAETISDKGRANVMKLVEAACAHAHKELKSLDANSNRWGWGVAHEVSGVLSRLATLLRSPWCPSDVSGLAVKLAQATVEYSANNQLQSATLDAKRLLILVEGQEDGTVQHCTQLAAQAATCDNAEALKIVEALDGLPPEWRNTVFRELLGNEQMTVVTALHVMDSGGYELRSSLVRGGVEETEFPLTVRGAFALRGWAQPTLDTADLLIERLAVSDDEMRYNATSIAMALLELGLSDDQILNMPAGLLASAMKTGSSAGHIGAVLLRELSGLSVNVWRQFDQMVQGFHGTLRMLIDVCRASHV